MFITLKCSKCNAPLLENGICSDFPICPTPAQQHQRESIAAPAEVGLGEGTQHDHCECKFCVCTPEALKRAMQVPVSLQQFQDYLLSQKQSFSSVPSMAEKVACIDAALHELDLFLFGEGLM